MPSRRRRAPAPPGPNWRRASRPATPQYYRTVGNERLTREILDLMSRLEQIAQARYAGGLVRAAGRDPRAGRADRHASGTDRLENEKRQRSARLNALLARDARRPLAEPAGAAPAAAGHARMPRRSRNALRARNPQLFAEEARITAAEKSRELTYATAIPTCMVGVRRSRSGTRSTEWELMLEVNIPLQQDTRRAQEREAEAHARRGALAQRSAGQPAARRARRENLVGLEAARRTETLIDDTSLLPQAELTFQSALAGYENGKVDFATLLDAQRQIRKARQDELKAQAEAQMRLADIERIVGEDL